MNFDKGKLLWEMLKAKKAKKEKNKPLLKPLYQHDCDRCIFLGLFEATIDLYYCEQNRMPTLIGRHSSGPQDYISGLGFVKVAPELAEAKRRAVKAGFFQCGGEF